MSGGQEQQNRKILEDLQKKKRLIRLQTQPGTGSLAQNRTKDGALSSNPRDLGEAHHLAMQQRQALEHAHNNSAAYFVTQDSAFGNLILPVIPRLPPD
ncbi:SOSS complex subunit C [Holothuria leucospilota]|uniref:SOSS complex subunit C n=1 Tax=Holothuria leucospilota TaxID=206669 RepID=A0A9Q1C980_HOLLE|nr:SOSS complex subunit C [Holothuria leucospilota]